MWLTIGLLGVLFVLAFTSRRSPGTRRPDLGGKSYRWLVERRADSR